MGLFGDLKLGQSYRVLCQNAACHAPLGAMHIPCAGGRVIFVCHLCGSVSMFSNGAYEIESKLLEGKVKVPVRPRG